MENGDVNFPLVQRSFPSRKAVPEREEMWQRARNFPESPGTSPLSGPCNVCN